jgi:hypothetical protein
MRRRFTTLALVAGGLSLVVAQPAAAGSWYSSGSPLRVYESNIAQGQAYGNMRNENGSYTRNDSYQYDVRSGGDPVYVRTQWKYTWSLLNGLWVNDDVRSTVRTSEAKWVFSYVHDAIRWDRDATRLVAKVCEDQRLSGDPCSVETGQTINY